MALFIARDALNDPSMINKAVAKEDSYRVEAHFTTLKLRLKTRLDDKRWQSFLNYENQKTLYSNLGDWFAYLGSGNNTGPETSILDLSMFSNEILPFACSVLRIGRAHV